MDLNDLRLFVKIAEKGSLVAAARDQGVSATTVSERLARLEAQYGVVLIYRTTRSISLTDEGQVLLEGAKSVLAEPDDLSARVRHGSQTLSGPIRLSAPIDLGRGMIAEIIAQFTNEHPKTTFDLYLSDGYFDVVGQGFDAALRFGDVADSSLRVRRLGAFRRIVCAAPSYFDRHGTLRVPADLVDHNCLTMRFGQSLDNVWHFGDGSTAQSVAVSGNKSANDGALVREWALAGLGVILKSELDIAKDLRSGRLIPVLESYAAPPTPLNLIFPPGRRKTARVQAFVEAVTAAIAST